MIACTLGTGALAGDDAKHHGSSPSKLPRFEQFKQLAGEWVGKEVGKDGPEVRVRYQVTSGGSTVVETTFAGSEHEMITVIHPDGDNLLLTHYCMLGNQPQMKAPGTGDKDKVEFKFVRATNLASEKDMHMHEVTFTFLDKDSLRTAWTHYNDGKAAGQVVFDLKRKP
jgi:hypothetical protein